MNPKQLHQFVRHSFVNLADPGRAVEMAAYMKTDEPFHGVPKPLRTPVYRQMKKDFIPETQKEYEQGVLILWKQPFREEKYAAIQFAEVHKRFITLDSLPLYEQMVIEGAWWDSVDWIADKLIGRVWLDNRKEVNRKTDQWIKNEKCMWLRRTAIIGQLKHKKQTDEARLFRYCLTRAFEKEFFIRKAIGWALRQYSYTSPEVVRDFLTEHESKLSVLSYREGAKQLVRVGMM